MASTLVLYGATGHSGRLVAAELKKWPTTGAAAWRVVLAGRDVEALREMAEDMDLDHTAFAVDDGPQLQRELADLGANVILNAAGPFACTAPALAEAAIALGCDYTDINGEADVYQHLARLHDRARDANVALVGSAGFWAAASNLLLRKALEDLESAPATAGRELGSIRIAMSRIETFSRGSAATVWRSLRTQVTVARRGTDANGASTLLLCREPVGKLERTFDFTDAAGGPADRRIASAASLVDTLAARVALVRRRQLPRSIDSYVEAGFPARAAYQAGAWLAPVLSLPRVRAVTQQSVRLLPKGPTPSERQDERHIILLEIEDSFRAPLVDWRWETPNVYDFTARLVAAVAGELGRGKTPTGWIAPCEILGSLPLSLDQPSGLLSDCFLQKRTA